MSYERRLLFERITLALGRKPSLSLRGLSRELRVSQRTIQNVVSTLAGKTFKDLRDEVLLEKAKSLFLSAPNATIKEASFEAGYGSPRAFARAVRRACGLSPEQLRARIARELAKKT